ncbi:alpha/beta fold hydrolase [Stakelama tenebrarum]|uniref:Alpha/beta hydrolase n=1 Tax=Stakelama tenebrarum TaxID=2711215 RepID=A0A6G6Y219_9SPHN|nr:alpha/beta hydrolase [Sphingosinithalassobacter tenebrarum]QIG78653.1 alpha/beta hydrolase [Sphingosinithalassobacter tenebrarum]
MARMQVDGIGIDYELIGEPGAPAVVVTPGGRFPRDMGGVPELAEALAAGGRQVLLWDRPNCGASDICFDGPGESAIQARALVGLVAALDLGPVALAAGSAGSRVSLIAASMAPERVSHLALWWISGGAISLAQLANYYCADAAMAATLGGMEAVADLPMWKAQIERNPANRDIILAQDKDDFIATMQRWAAGYAYSETSPVPGMTPEDFAKLTMPALIYRSGRSDLSHTRRTSEWVAELLPDAEITDPPWPDEEWNDRFRAQHHGESLFAHWPDLAPEILAFLHR